MNWFTKRFEFFKELFISFVHTRMFPACCFRKRIYVAQGYMNGALSRFKLTCVGLLVECF